jgi:hypothetical protein
MTGINASGNLEKILKISSKFSNFWKISNSFEVCQTSLQKYEIRSNLRHKRCRVRWLDFIISIASTGSEALPLSLALHGLMVTSVTKGATQKLSTEFKTVEIYRLYHSLESSWGALSDGAIDVSINFFGKNTFSELFSKNIRLIFYCWEKWYPSDMSLYSYSMSDFALFYPE